MKIDIKEAYEWFTPEIAQLLEAIKPPHQARKRNTILRLAFALAAQIPVATIFERDDTCNQTTWYARWKDDPAIKAAYEACCKRISDWVDQETAAAEAQSRLQRRRAIAEWSAKAPAALGAIMLDQSARAADRISAANALMGWADPEAAEKVRPASPAASFEQQVGFDLKSLSDDELDAAILAHLEMQGQLPANLNDPDLPEG